MSDPRHHQDFENGEDVEEEELEMNEQMQQGEEMDENEMEGEDGEQGFIKAFDMQLNDEQFLLLLGKTDEEKLLFRLISKEDESKPFYQNEFSLEDLKQLNENFTAFENPDEAFIYIIEKMDDCEKELNHKNDEDAIILSLVFIEENGKINLDLILHKIVIMYNEEENEEGMHEMHEMHENMEEDEEEVINNLQNANGNNFENENENEVEEIADNLAMGVPNMNIKEEDVHPDLPLKIENVQKEEKNIENLPVSKNVETTTVTKTEIKSTNDGKEITETKKIVNIEDGVPSKVVEITEKKVVVDNKNDEKPEIKNVEINENKNDNNLNLLGEAVNQIENDNKNINVKINDADLQNLKNEFLKQLDTLSENFNKQLKLQNDTFTQAQNKLIKDNETKFQHFVEELNNKDNELTDLRNKYSIFNKKIENLENNFKNQEMLIQNYDDTINNIGNAVNDLGEQINKINKRINDKLKNEKPKNDTANNNVVNNADIEKQKNDINKISNDLNNAKKDFDKKFKDFDTKINSTRQNLDSKVDNKLNDVFMKMNDVDKKIKEIQSTNNSNRNNFSSNRNDDEILNKFNILDKKTKNIEDRMNNIENNKRNNDISFNGLDKRTNNLENKLSNLEKQSNDLLYKTESIFSKTNYLENLAKDLDNKTKNLDNNSQILFNKLNQLSQKENINMNECKSVDKINVRSMPKRNVEYDTRNNYINSENNINMQNDRSQKSLTHQKIENNYLSNNDNLNNENYYGEYKITGKTKSTTEFKPRANNDNNFTNQKKIIKTHIAVNPPYLIKCAKIIDSKIISYNQMGFLEKRLKEIELKINAISFSLVYRATEDGDRAADFHNKCDKIGPNITFVKTKNGFVFGGFTCKNWEHLKRDIKINKPNLGSASRDSRAFCFCFNNQKIYNNERPNEFAIWCNRNYGPTFKNNFFQIFDECLTKGGYCSVRANSHFGGQEIDYEIIGGNGARFGVNELEVYEVIFQ